MVEVQRRDQRRDTTPRRRRTVTVNAFAGTVANWWTNKKIFDNTKKLLDGDKDKSKPGADPGLRLTVLEEVKRIGVPDEKGNRFHVFPEPVAGLKGLKAQRAVTPTFNTDLAEEKLAAIGPDALAACRITVLELVPDKQHLVLKALQDAGLAEECVSNVGQEIDQDRVWGYHALHKDQLTDADLNEITPDTETWSLIPIEVDA